MTISGKHVGKVLLLVGAVAHGGCSASDATESADEDLVEEPSDATPGAPVICNEMGCLSGVGITIRAADGSWPAGTYSLTITDDEATHTCQVTLPGDLPERGSTSEIVCDPAIGFPGASLAQDATCMEQRTADAIGESCTPIPDQYTLSVFIQRTPEALSVAVTRDGEPLAEVSEELEYVEHHPNGEECEPTCRGAGVEVVLE